MISEDMLRKLIRNPHYTMNEEELAQVKKLQESESTNTRHDTEVKTHDSGFSVHSQEVDGAANDAKYKKDAND